MKRTHFFALQKQTFFSSKKGKDTEKIIEKYKCVCVCVCPQALTLSWPGNVANREFAAGKGWVVCLIPPYLCCYTGFPCSKSFPLDLSLLHADSRRKAWRSSWYSFTLSKLIHAHFQSPASKTCPGSFQDHSVLSLPPSSPHTSCLHLVL